MKLQVGLIMYFFAFSLVCFILVVFLHLVTPTNHNLPYGIFIGFSESILNAWLFLLPTSIGAGFLFLKNKETTWIAILMLLTSTGINFVYTLLLIPSFFYIF